MNFYEELKERGLIEAVSNEEIISLINKDNGEGISFYIGFDPTAQSLQIGNLLCILLMKRFQEKGHKPYCVMGGATGMIGDPSGKSNERILLNDEIILHNLACQKMQLQNLLNFDDSKNSAVMMNNHDWMGKFSFIDFLRDIGKRFRVTEMLAKESVKNRIESEVGISFTEFSYQILQAYDFRFLAHNHNVILQMGGSDQWGNITAGIDLARKMDGKQVYGIVIPLVTDSKGNKFGKSEGSTAIYLDPEMTSPYQMYQFLLNSEDSSVIKYLKYFTFLSLEEIASIELEMHSAPHLRTAQKCLAQELVKIVHGEIGLAQALKATKIFFGESFSQLKDNELTSIFKDVPSILVPRSELNVGLTLLDLLALTPLFASKGEAKRSLDQKGVYLNNEAVIESTLIIDQSSLASETCLLLRKGKKNYCLVRFI